MNHSTIEQLYRRYGPAVLRRGRAILGNEEMAQDLLQEVFMQVVEQRGRFRGEASPMTWIYRITTNLALNRLRDGRRRDELLREKQAPPGAVEPLVEARLTLAAILLDVPEELRAIAIYHHVDRMSHAEIAGILGVSRRTIGNRLEEFHRRARVAAGTMEVAK